MQNKKLGWNHWPRCSQTPAQCNTGSNRAQLVLFGMQNRKLGPFLEAVHRSFIQRRVWRTFPRAHTSGQMWADVICMWTARSYVCHPLVTHHSSLNRFQLALLESILGILGHCRPPIPQDPISVMGGPTVCPNPSTHPPWPLVKQARPETDGRTDGWTDGCSARMLCFDRPGCSFLR
jgi:hypothetical protein